MKKVLLIISVICFCGCSTIYNISKEELKSQLLKVEAAAKKDTLKKNTHEFTRVACYNEKNQKLWLYINKEVKLRITSVSSEKPFPIAMYGMKIRNDSLISYFSWPILFDTAFAFPDIKKIEIAAQAPYTEPYKNIDSLNEVAVQLNNKQKEDCKKDNNQIIQLKITSSQRSLLQDDYLYLFANAVYSLGFKDKTRIKYGLVHRIQNDSIFISNAFNENVAKNENITYQIMRFPVKDIVSMDLYRTYNTADHIELMPGDFVTKTLENYQYDDKPCPFYKVQERNGILFKYYYWLTLSGYFGLTESEGKVCW